MNSKTVTVESANGRDEVELSKQELKYFNAAAGEYGVLSELNKRFIETQMTIGNKKAVDILFFQRSTGLWRSIEVKSTMMERKIITSFFQKYGDRQSSKAKPDFWILVKTDPKTLTSEFRILTHDEMGAAQMKRNGMKVWESWPNGVDSVTWEVVDEVVPDALNGWHKLA